MSDPDDTDRHGDPAGSEDADSADDPAGSDPVDPADDPFAELEDLVAGADPEVDELFDEMAVADVDEDGLWEELEGDGVAGTVDSAGTQAPSSPGADARSAARADEAAAVEDADLPPGEAIVAKERYCQRCEHFAEPPDVGCGNPGTEIVELVDVDRFRLRDCPVVERRRGANRDVFRDDGG